VTEIGPRNAAAGADVTNDVVEDVVDDTVDEFVVDAPADAIACEESVNLPESLVAGFKATCTPASIATFGSGCPTANLLGCCHTGSAYGCYYAGYPTISSAMAACSGPGQTWVTTL
jgi:hypothetical protein